MQNDVCVVMPIMRPPRKQRSEVKLLTIILNYKTAPMTLRAAEAALRAMDGISGEILIIDNDSQDGSFDILARHVQDMGWNKDNQVRVLQSDHNGGFGAGNNIGIKAGLCDGSVPDFVYILNSDAFPEPGAIQALLDHLRANPDTAFAGSYIMGEDGTSHTTAFRFPSIFSEMEGSIRFGPVSRLLKHHRVPIEPPEHSQPVDWLAGASLMMRQSVLDEIGLFDETFFLYFEETDLCRRAHLAGYKIAYVRESTVTHIGSVSTGMNTWKRVPRYWFDSRLHYFVKNHGSLYAAIATLAHLAGGGLHWLRHVITRKEHGISPYFLRTMARHDLAVLARTVFNLGRRDSRPSDPRSRE